MNTAGRQKQSRAGYQNKEGGFAKAYYTLPHNILDSAREEISNLCYWSSSAFDKKRAGTRRFRDYEIEVISKYFAAKGIDAWTGELITK